MIKEKINIIDESGDKKYFTIIPNYVLNHSTIYDREVYIQMKRIAGESGTCWISQGKLAKKCGLSVNRVKTSLKYLVEHKWIGYVGKKSVSTNGGEQKTNEYKITDLWQLNNSFYNDKGVSPDDTPANKGVSPDDTKVYHQNDKGVSPGSYKEEPLNNNHIKKILQTDVCGNEINPLIKLFEQINPSISYGNKTQREALEWLVEKYGLEKATGTIKYAVSIQGRKFAPTITTPAMLKSKLGDLMIYYKKENTNPLIVKI
ncbi:helix-turn-helix domain-containing protein [Candidatus Dojkabacteria bacterium]|jgi:hypothetical protein|nr:helix-turn-helix domain-containing protein [Candidatus Dojkabacteria bacterium]